MKILEPSTKIGDIFFLLNRVTTFKLLQNIIQSAKDPVVSNYLVRDLLLFYQNIHFLADAKIIVS